MATSMSRRRIVTRAAAATAGAALAPTSGTAAEAAAWTPTDEPARVFDVRRFGAKGDGVAIDSDAVNRAIDEAANARSPRGGGRAAPSTSRPARTPATRSA